MRTSLRYGLLQVPGALVCAGVAWTLWSFGGLPGWAAVALVVFWVAKDAVFYPVLRTSYENRPSKIIGPERLIGASGIAEDKLAPRGYVRVEKELWRAELHPPSDPPIARGSQIRICGLRDLTLLVTAQPDPPAPDEPVVTTQGD